MNYHAEFEKFKKEGQDYVEKISFEYERKIKALEEKLKMLEANRKVVEVGLCRNWRLIIRG